MLRHTRGAVRFSSFSGRAFGIKSFTRLVRCEARATGDSVRVLQSREPPVAATLALARFFRSKVLSCSTAYTHTLAQELSLLCVSYVQNCS